MQNESVVIKDVPYSADSLKRIELYTPVANLTLRVPTASLDSVVHTLTAMATFIDYRTLKDEDKTLTYLSNAMKTMGLYLQLLNQRRKVLRSTWHTIKIKSMRQKRTDGLQIWRYWMMYIMPHSLCNYFNLNWPTNKSL
ncbi:DUF4349 domain-containing protein [Chitinophaga pinensis]|uniref:DUF4349 domain-containing protein n=1 Tax=Chitinophaga pinensis TaxID=79329 RepID=UPI001C997D47|nr:DUF4349 domain-containing protein [Chitinophaga pinensis]